MMAEIACHPSKTKIILWILSKFWRVKINRRTACKSTFHKLFGVTIRKCIISFTPTEKIINETYKQSESYKYNGFCIDIIKISLKSHFWKYFNIYPVVAPFWISTRMLFINWPCRALLNAMQVQHQSVEFSAITEPFTGAEIANDADKRHAASARCVHKKTWR